MDVKDVLSVKKMQPLRILKLPRKNTEHIVGEMLVDTTAEMVVAITTVEDTEDPTMVKMLNIVDVLMFLTFSILTHDKRLSIVFVLSCFES